MGLKAEERKLKLDLRKAADPFATKANRQGPGAGHPGFFFSMQMASQLAADMPITLISFGSPRV